LRFQIYDLDLQEDRQLFLIYTSFPSSNMDKVIFAEQQFKPEETILSCGKKLTICNVGCWIFFVPGRKEERDRQNGCLPSTTSQEICFAAPSTTLSSHLPK
jgi:hypothetical protein